MNNLGRRELLAAALAGGAVPLRAVETKGRFIDSARQFLDTMTEKGTDRYGKKQTPLFCLSLDPETHAPPKPPSKIDMQYARSFEYLFRDYGYYWKSHLHSAGPIYDQRVDPRPLCTIRRNGEARNTVALRMASSTFFLPTWSVNRPACSVGESTSSTTSFSIT